MMDAFTDRFGEPLKTKWTEIKDWIFEHIIDPLKSAWNFITDLPGNIGGGIKGFFGKAFGFQDGGTVPGPIGKPMMAVVHGGERISTPSSLGGGGGKIIQVIIGNKVVKELVLDSMGEIVRRQGITSHGFNHA